MTATLYHGTNSISWAKAQQEGQLTPKFDPKQLAGQIEDEFGLPTNSVWEHPVNAFSHTRQGDPHIYLTGSYRVACDYARIGSEVLEDTLAAAFALLHPEFRQRTPETRAAQRDFAAAWRSRHGMRPVVLTLAVPFSHIPVPDSAKIRDPEKWFEAASEQEPLNTLMLTGPLPTTWVTATQELGDLN